MRTMITISLLLNLVVLMPVCASLVTGAAWVAASYGPPAPARQILLSVYLAIGVVSAILVFNGDPRAVAALLLVQVIYKLTKPLTVGTLYNPVVVTNLGIAAVHAATLFAIWCGADAS